MANRGWIVSLFVVLTLGVTAESAYAEVETHSLDIKTAKDYEYAQKFFEGRKFSKFYCAATWNSQKLFVWYEASNDGKSVELNKRLWGDAAVKDVANDIKKDDIVLCGFSPSSSGNTHLWYFRYE